MCWRATTRPLPRRSPRSAAAYQADPSPDNLARLQEAVEPPRQELFRRLNMAPGGTAALVEMRRQLLKKLKAQPALARHRLRPDAPAALVVQPRLPAPGAHRLAHLGDRAREADPVRGGARDPGLARPAPAPRGRPALLRVLPSAAARRADHLHRGGADARHERARPAAARHRLAGGRRRTPIARCSTRSPTARKGCAASRSATC